MKINTINNSRHIQITTTDENNRQIKVVIKQPVSASDLASALKILAVKLETNHA